MTFDESASNSEDCHQILLGRVNSEKGQFHSMALGAVSCNAPRSSSRSFLRADAEVSAALLIC